MCRSMTLSDNLKIPYSAKRKKADLSNPCRLSFAHSPMPDMRMTLPKSAHMGGILRYLGVTGLVFLVLMVTLEPDVGFVAPPPIRLLYWMIQIGIGLFVLQSTLYIISRILGASRMPSWTMVVLSGFVGAVVLAPVYWLVGEGMMVQWLGYPVLPDENNFNFGGPTVVVTLVEEYFDIVGPVTTAWALICLPRMHWLVPPLLHRQTHSAVDAKGSCGSDQATQPDAPAPDRDPTEVTAIGKQALSHELPPVEECPDSARVHSTVAASLPAPDWHSRLPTELGSDVIAVASELQYLRVWTPRGCALIIGALADVEAEEGANGLRVHRSWWVACKHVTSVRRTAAGVVCQMSDGRQVPVSRRRRAEVLARFGNGARYLGPATSKTIANTDLE